MEMGTMYLSPQSTRRSKEHRKLRQRGWAELWAKTILVLIKLFKPILDTGTGLDLDVVGCFYDRLLQPLWGSEIWWKMLLEVEGAYADRAQ